MPCNNTNNLHAPYGNKETTYMRFVGVLAIIIFGSIFLLIRFLNSQLKKVTEDFIINGMKSLAEQALLFFILISGFTILYVYGAFDNIKINWQFLLSGIFLFIIIWFLFCGLITLFGYLVVRKWNELENSFKSFCKLYNLLSSNA